CICHCYKCPRSPLKTCPKSPELKWRLSLTTLALGLVLLFFLRRPKGARRSGDCTWRTKAPRTSPSFSERQQKMYEDWLASTDGIESCAPPRNPARLPANTLPYVPPATNLKWGFSKPSTRLWERSTAQIIRGKW